MGDVPSTILQIVPCYVDFSRETGGVANIVRHLSLGLARRGRHVIVVCGNRELGRVQAKPTHSVEGQLEISVVEQYFHPLLGPPANIKAILDRTTTPVVAHVHTCFSMLTESAMATFQRRHVPYVFTPHGKLSLNMFGKQKLAKRLWWRLSGLKAVSSASQIAVSSPVETSEFSNLGLKPDRHVVVPNGYESSQLLNNSGSTARITNEPYILFLGYIDPRKQPELLVQAFARSKCINTHRLVLAGPDAYGHLSVVKKEIERCGIQDRVIIYGPAYGPQKWQLLQQAACFCLPSRGEGLPVALCEALGAGLPILISRECNFHAAVVEGAAIELDSFDTMAWSGALDSICMRPDVHSSMSIAAAAMGKRFTWDHVLDQWLEVYDSVAAAHAGRAPNSLCGSLC